MNAQRNSTATLSPCLEGRVRSELPSDHGSRQSQKQSNAASSAVTSPASAEKRKCLDFLVTTVDRLLNSQSEETYFFAPLQMEA